MMEKADTVPSSIGTDDHVAESESAATMLIAYCDFECPYCGRAETLMRRNL